MKEVKATALTLKLNNHVVKIRDFFERYPRSFITSKLRDAYQSNILLSAANGAVCDVEDFVFYEDLLSVIQYVEQVNLTNCLPNSFIPSFDEYSLVSVDGVINLIKQAIPVGTIYNLGRTRGELDLLIVLERSCAKPYSEFESIVDLAMLNYPNSTCTVHNYGLLNTLIANGHLFYATACIEDNIVYQKSTVEAFTPVNKEKMLETMAVAEEKFQKGMDRATSFYRGANIYLKSGLLEMAIFMLHQACELTYRCLLNALKGRDLKSHSPAILRKHIKRFAPEIIGAFSEDEEKELHYLHILEIAYVDSRYNETYKVDENLIVLLNDQVGLLQERANKIFRSKMETLKVVADGR